MAYDLPIKDGESLTRREIPLDIAISLEGAPIGEHPIFRKIGDAGHMLKQRIEHVQVYTPAQVTLYLANTFGLIAGAVLSLDNELAREAVVRTSAVELKTVLQMYNVIAIENLPFDGTPAQKLFTAQRIITEHVLLQEVIAQRILIGPSPEILIIQTAEPSQNHPHIRIQTHPALLLSLSEIMIEKQVYQITLGILGGFVLALDLATKPLRSSKTKNRFGGTVRRLKKITGILNPENPLLPIN